MNCDAVTTTVSATPWMNSEITLPCCLVVGKCPSVCVPTEEIITCGLPAESQHKLGWGSLPQLGTVTWEGLSWELPDTNSPGSWRNKYLKYFPLKWGVWEHMTLYTVHYTAWAKLDQKSVRREPLMLFPQVYSCSTEQGGHLEGRYRRHVETMTRALKYVCLEVLVLTER